MKFIESQSIAKQVAIDILDKFWQVAEFRDFMRNHFSQHCYKNSIKFAHQTLIEESRKPQENDKYEQEKQPNPLYMDNFFPAAADIEQKTPKGSKNSSQVKSNQYKGARSPTQQSVSQVSKNSKKKFGNKHLNPFETLDLPPAEEEEAIIKEMRKSHEEKLLKEKEEAEKNRKKQSPKKKGNKNERLGFDYDGEVMNIRNDGKSNLVSGGLDGAMSSSIQKLNEAKKNIPPSKIEYDRKVPPKPSAKAIDIQFTDIKTLFSEATVTKGIKLSEGGITIEEKQKKVSLKELKNSLSGRRLTKDEYTRIRQSTGNIVPFDDLSKSQISNSLKSSIKLDSQQNNTAHLRSASQSKLSNSLTRRKSTITISDPQLLDQLLYGPVNQAQERTIIRNNQEEDRSESKLDSIDNYNLMYMKKAGSIDMKKSKSIADLSKIKLPKIHGSPSHHNLLLQSDMPRVREKLRDQNGIIRTIRRTFDEKLRL